MPRNVFDHAPCQEQSSNMTAGLRITEVERITLHVPFRSRVEPWLNLLNFQWGIVEVIRVVTDSGHVGYGETLPHYTWGKVSDEAIERMKNSQQFGKLVISHED